MVDEISNKVETEPDFIAIKRYGNSLAALGTRYTHGAPDYIIAKALNITEEEVEIRYQKIIALLRAEMGI